MMLLSMMVNTAAKSQTTPVNCLHWPTHTDATQNQDYNDLRQSHCIAEIELLLE